MIFGNAIATSTGRNYSDSRKIAMLLQFTKSEKTEFTSYTGLEFNERFDFDK